LNEATRFSHLFGGATFYPLASGSQQKAMPVIGYLEARHRAPGYPALDPFHQGLSATGFVGGQNQRDPAGHRRLDRRSRRVAGGSLTYNREVPTMFISQSKVPLPVFLILGFWLFAVVPQSFAAAPGDTALIRVCFPPSGPIGETKGENDGFCVDASDLT
jgi:hypothetical protein